MALREHVRDLAVRVRLACVEKLGRFCGDEAVLALGERPRVPEFGEESQLPPLPEDWDDPKAIVWWGQMVREEGLSEGEVRGLVKGEDKGRKAVARSLLEKGMAEAEIAEVAGLTPEEVAALGQEMSHCE